ncbi:hypothetical protein SDRG_14227 [Saprolegnia diclina VS20]|uniref:K Homology domain-containing protein n=1 Tax=Saprolegnia diclina (strain VS20) TaxID=1156394 RepID=T0Q3I4_SAPDV|nr:hypothetical protein SDRG_14227 [Saprolegnia diclina VS20]EQC27950.1 hypothetical protein SDRG_14227 [Saprolegnia diclina VS20]|eukprot:XP_008618563.1 hypothetical protein SDRG_14227 [Saprolegnia diclina VS20]
MRGKTTTTLERVALPPNTAGLVIGAKGVHMQRLRAVHRLSKCRVTTIDGVDHVLLEGAFINVNAAKAEVTALVSKCVARLARATGYKPLFSLFVLGLPSSGTSRDSDTAEAPTFTRVPIAAPTQRLVDVYDEVRALRAFTLSATGTLPPPPPIHVRLHTKQTLVGYAEDAIAMYVTSAHAALVETWSSSSATPSLRLSVGKTFMQQRQWDASDKLSVSAVQTLQTMVRHQFCSSVLSNVHMESAQAWCDENGYAPPTTSRYVVVNVVHLVSGDKMQWTRETGDASTLGHTLDRLGFLSLVALDAKQVGCRLDFRQQRALATDGGMRALSDALEAAYGMRDASGYFTLAAESLYTIDCVQYHKEETRCHATSGLRVSATLTRRCATVLANDDNGAPHVWSLAISDPALDDGGFDEADVFVHRVMAVLRAGLQLVDAINMT